MLHALQYCGHFIRFSILPAVFASFPSALHFFCRSRIAVMPALGLFVAFASDAGFAGAGVVVVCAKPSGAVSGDAISAAASTAEKPFWS